jgi:hypothetical protein
MPPAGQFETLLSHGGRKQAVPSFDLISSSTLSISDNALRNFFVTEAVSIAVRTTMVGLFRCSESA